MKKLLAIVVMGLLLNSCQSPEEKAFKNCIDSFEGENYEGKTLDEFGATLVCQELKKKMPDVFRISEGKVIEYLTYGK